MIQIDSSAIVLLISAIEIVAAVLVCFVLLLYQT